MVVLGEQVDLRDLVCSEGYSGRFDFHRTHDTPDEDVYIVKRKGLSVKANGKRPATSPIPTPSAKQPRIRQPKKHSQTASSEQHESTVEAEPSSAQ